MQSLIAKPIDLDAMWETLGAGAERQVSQLNRLDISDTHIRIAGTYMHRLCFFIVLYMIRKKECFPGWRHPLDGMDNPIYDLRGYGLRSFVKPSR